MPQKLILAACQLPDIHRDVDGDIDTDIDTALSFILSYAKLAESKGADLVCYPECFLQGYEVSAKTHELAIDLASSEFKDLLSQLKEILPILVIGIIEIEDSKLFNTAVVVQQGQLLGRYRKVNLLKGEQEVFEAGSDYPIFDLGDITFGINICYDLNFADTLETIAKQGAELLVCPSNNMMRFQSAELWKDKHIESRVERARAANIAILSSDVTGSTKTRISYGPTAFIDKQGTVIKQLPLQKEGLLIHTLTP